MTSSLGSFMSPQGIPSAPAWVASGGVTFAAETGCALRGRYFGPRPLIEDDSVRSLSSLIFNARATALYTTPSAIPKLVDQGLLRARKEHGRLFIDSSSVRRFRSRYIGLQEILAATGGHGDATTAQLERRGIRTDKKLAKCGFVGFHRSEVETELGWLKSLIGQRAAKAA